MQHHAEYKKPTGDSWKRRKYTPAHFKTNWLVAQREADWAVTGSKLVVLNLHDVKKIHLIQGKVRY